MNRFRQTVNIVAVLVILFVPSLPAFARDVPIASQDEVIIQDAQAYASVMGINLDEAIRQLNLQSDISALNGELSEKEAGSFGGLWIQHKPDYRVIALFTANGQETIRPYIESGPLANTVETRAARNTFDQLEAARSQAARLASAVGIQSTSSINVAENRAELFVLDADQLATALRHGNMELPDAVTVVLVKELPEPVADIYGGLAISLCTSGFAVKNTSNVKGISTAGHCDNTQSYAGIGLPFMAGTAWPCGGSCQYDVQWNRADQNFTVRNWINIGASTRLITTVIFRANQVVGSSVCRYGKNSGYACATISANNQDGVNVRVDNIDVIGGDSGGPWFWNNTAYGTTISHGTFVGGGVFSIYAPVDQLYNILGLTILTS